MATGELDTLLNRWLSRATLDVIGEGESWQRSQTRGTTHVEP